MKLSSNYSLHDWKIFSLFILLNGLFFTPIFLVLSPVLDIVQESNDFLIFISDNQVLEKYFEYVQDSPDFDQRSTSIGFALLFNLIGGAIIPLFLIFWYLCSIPKIINIVAKKLKIFPMMKLVVFYNGKPLGKKK